MTSVQPIPQLPARSFDPTQYDIGGEYFNKEYTAYNALRESYLQKAMNATGLLKQPGNTQSMSEVPQPGPKLDWTDDDLLGAAAFWNVPLAEAAQMPRDKLIAYINEMRMAARASDVESSEVMFRATALASFGLGAAQAVTRGLRNLPLVGESFGRIEALHKANIFMKKLEEGVRASNPESIQPVITGAQITGNLAAMVGPGIVAWNAAGAMGAVVPYASRLSPIVRGAVQGATSTYLLEGGNPDTEGHAALVYGLGAGLGAAGPGLVAAWRRFAPVAEAAANRTAGAFVPRWADGSVYGPKPEVTLGLQQIHPAPGGFNPGHVEGNFGSVEGLQPSVPFEGGQLTPLPKGFQAEPDLLNRQYPEGFSTVSQATRRRPQGFVTNEAEANAIGLTKTSTVMNSPEYPSLVAQPRMDDATVARAAMGQNPGGTNVVQAVADPAAFAAETVELTGAHVRYATPRGTKRLDALISDEPITNQMVKEYETHGVYTGQQVASRNGLVGSVESINGSEAVLRLANSEARVRVNVGDLSPSTVSPGMTEVPQLWNDFIDYAQFQAARSAKELGAGSAVQIDVLLKQNMPQYVERFLDSMQITRQGDRARIMKYFDMRYVEEFKKLAPAEVIQSERMTQHALTVMDNSPPLSALQHLDELGASRGLVVTPARGGGYTVIAKDAGHNTEITFETVEAAETWMRNFQRDMPDISPKLDVPGEVSAMHLQEAPQQPNLNARMENGIADELASIAETSPEDAGFIAGLSAQVQSLKEQGLLGKLQNIYINGFTNLSSMRRLFSTMDEFAAQGNLTGLTPFKDYQAISVATNARHNFEEPLQEAAAQVIQNIRVANRRSGLWSQMYMIEDAAERVAKAKAAGLNDAEIAAFDQMSAVWHRLFGETGLPVERELKQYMPMLQKMQSIGDYSGMELWKVTAESDAFFKHVRNGLINVREMDPESLLNSYIKTLSWDKYLAEPFEQVAKKWNQISRDIPELEPASQIVRNWLHTVRYGYQPGPDALLDWSHAVAQTMLGKGVTRHQARQLVNYGLNASYSSLMGFRLDIVARDLQQVWLGLPRAGPRLLDVMRRYMTGGSEVRQAMWESAVADNMVSLVHPRSMAPGATHNMEQAAFEGADAVAGQISKRQIAAGKVTAAIEDMVPNWMKSEKLRPTYLYGRQGEMSRMLVGTAQKEIAAEAISAFRAAGPNGSMADLVHAAKADTYYPAVRREFERLVGMGADDEAAKFLGRQLADASQFKYGSGEGPVANRTVSGRLFAQLGSYPLYYGQYLMEVARHGTPATKVATLATVGTISAAFSAAAHATGWNFNRLNPFTGLGFTGGPALQEGLALAKTGSAYIAEATGQRSADSPPLPGLGNTAADVANLFNPVKGLITTGDAVRRSLDSPLPGAALTRFALTGAVGPGPDLNASWQPQQEQWFQNLMQPMQGPVRNEGHGTTVVPQQQVTSPPEVQLNDSLTYDEQQFLGQLGGLPNELKGIALQQYRQRQRGRDTMPVPPGGGAQF